MINTENYRSKNKYERLILSIQFYKDKISVEFMPEDRRQHIRDLISWLEFVKRRWDND